MLFACAFSPVPRLFCGWHDVCGTFPEVGDPMSTVDHFPLVRQLAWHVHRRVSSSVEVNELVQVGMVALVEASRTFEDRGFEFATYASIRIKGSMIHHLRRGSGRSRSATSSRRSIEAARRAVEQVRKRSPTPSEIAARMDVPLADYFAMEADALGVAHESIDETYSDSDVAFCATTPLQDDTFDAHATTERLRRALDTLDVRSRLVLQLYFFEELSLEEIGQVLDVGAARVCQIKKAGLAKLQTIDGLMLG